MSLTLLRKELREHGAVLLVAFAIVGFVLLALLFEAATQSGGRFTGLTRFSLLCGILLPFVLANRLMVREYSGRTQLFLETLPIGRLRIFATKWLLGCVLSLLAIGGAWFATFAIARRTEVLLWADVRGTLLSFGLFWFAVWCFAAMAGMLGRYRYLAWALAVAAYFLVNQVAGVPLFEAPLIRLLGNDVQMARGLPNAQAFATAVSIAGACFAASLALALLGNGSLAATLARRMTARERVFALVTLTAVLTLAVFLERKPELEPFMMNQGEQVAGRHARVAVMPTADLAAPAARRLATRVASDIDSLIDALALDTRPSVFVLPQSGLDGDTVESGAVAGAEGIAIRMAPEARYERVGALIAHNVVTQVTLGRGLRDDRHVLLDGLTAYWPVRGDDAGQVRWRRRAAAVDEPITVEALLRWDATSEALGECLSLALAFTVHEALLALLGEERALALLGALFTAPADDARIVLERAPAGHLAAAGIDWHVLADRADAVRRAARDTHADALRERPAITWTIDWLAQAGRGIEVFTRLEGVAPYAVYYAKIGPWARGVVGLPRLDVRNGQGVLPLSLVHGDRVAVALEVEDPVLDCDVRVGARRLELR